VAENYFVNAPRCVGLLLKKFLLPNQAREKRKLFFGTTILQNFKNTKVSRPRTEPRGGPDHTNTSNPHLEAHGRGKWCLQ